MSARIAARLLVALVRDPHEPVRVGRGAERLLRGAVAAMPVTYGLEMPATAAGALTRQPVVDDHDVAELDAAPAAAERDARARSLRRRPRCRASASRGRRRRVRHPTRHSPIAGGVRVVVEADGQAEAVLDHAVAEREVVEGRFTHSTTPRRLVDRRRDAEADRPHLVVQQLVRPPPRALRAPLPASPSGSGARARRRISPERVTTPARIFVPPRSTPMA